MLAKRMSRLGTETAFEVLARAKQLEKEGKEIVHLEIGEPDFDTPENIREACKKALDEGYTHYTPSGGIPEVREVIAEYISKTRNISVSPEEVVITPGAKPIIFFSILALVDEGDEVLYPDPGFPIYESVVNFVGAKPIPIPLEEKFDFLFDLNKFKDLITEKTKLIILNSPHNPTGSVMTKQFLKELYDILKDKENIYILSDEVYEKIIYDEEHYSIASFPGMKERTIILNGFSKTYAMTGWRLGYGVMNKKLAESVTRLQTNSNSCTASFVQISGMEAIKGPQDEVEKMVEEFKRRRDVIVKGLNEIKGFKCHLPKGAFYVFPDIRETGKTSKELEKILLEEAGVACLSGTAFGKYGEGFLRFSYANSIENIEKAINKIKEVLGG
ncbi:MAG: pyridoxal phosphate-dependent aminotransferase [Caldiserica bacterium]|nr:MAG: pyridoxal phosphate-dependent aminotransferase [Caldisericota bacterium]